MRLFKILIGKDVPFWSLGDIKLSSINPLSDLLDADNTDFEDLLIIEKSARLREVAILTPDHNIFNGSLGDLPFSGSTNALNQYKVDTEDDKESVFKDDIPELVSVTLDGTDEEDKEESVPEENIEISYEHIKQAKILLNQNGNTVKKALNNLPYNRNAYAILRACLDAESALSGKRRKGIIKAIQTLINDYDE